LARPALLTATDELRLGVEALSFSAPVTHVYDPLVYAREPYERYLRRYGRGHKDVVLLGMNPGPFGMAQTGVPFGEVGLVRDWLGIRGTVGRPLREHPKRPVLGFACTRSEVSGRRLWGLVRKRFETPERFFASFFVANYCPLVFLEKTGRNRTPDRLPAHQRAALFEVCDRALRRSVRCMRPRLVIGIGRFAEERAVRALADLDVQVGRIPHPSPASPAANRGWETAALHAFRKLGIGFRP
jgi:single-strand selective monofunctional uracil DNA glycosylase